MKVLQCCSLCIFFLPPQGPTQSPFPGLHNAAPPVSYYQSSPVSPTMPVRPPMGGPLPPPLQAGQTPVPSQNSAPPPVSSTNNYYPNAQNLPLSSWNYGPRPPMGMATPPPGNHVTSSPSPVPTPPSKGFSAPPPGPNASVSPGPPLPPSSLSSWAQPQPGKDPGGADR